MDLFHLKLNRFEVANYRSIKHLGLDHLGPLVCVAGRNNAGKSNLLDAFQFLADAAVSFDHALASRGRDFLQLVHRKKPQHKMEFTFVFALAAEKRAELVQQLFAENPAASVPDILASEFLTTLTLKVVIARDHFSEELSTGNLRSHLPWPIFSIKGSPKKTEVICGQLEPLCQACQDELGFASAAADLPPEPTQPYRLRLGRPESAAAFPISYELADGVRRQFESLGGSLPLTALPSADSRQPALSADATNLPDVLHWIYNNKPSQFRRIETQIQKLVPRLGKLHTPTLHKTTTLAVIDPRDEDLVFSFPEVSAGVKAVVTLVSKVMLAAPGAWVCLDKPETSLHPQAQAQLIKFLRAESAAKRIFCATHSSALAAACPMASLFLLKRHPDHGTVVQPVTPLHAAAVIEELSIATTFSLERHAVVFVEQADYVPVYEAWAKNFVPHLGIQFLAWDGGDTLHYHANARVALSRWVRTNVLAVFGNGSTEARQLLSQHLRLEDDQIIIMDFPELEGCLLDPKAIRKAFSAVTLSEAELQARFDPALVLLNQKKALGELLAEFKIGDYDGHLGGRIAEAMESLPVDVAQLFKKIEARAKPFWEI